MCQYCDQLMNEELFHAQGYRSTDDIIYLPVDCGPFGKNGLEVCLDISTIGPDARTVTNDTYSLHLYVDSPFTNDIVASDSISIQYCPFCGRKLEEVNDGTGKESVFRADA